MRTWIQTIEESTQLFSPIGLRLIDDLTGNSPIGRIQAILELQDAGGEWKDTKIAPVITASGTVTYPGLERHADATGKLPKQFRVRLKPQFYLPLYQRDRDGLLLMT